MLLFGDLADWWDARRREANTTLDQWVEDVARGGSEGELIAVVLAATVTHTAMEIGGGFVDVLRLGRGVARGTVGGVAQDGLRLLTVLPAVGQTLRLHSRLLARFAGTAVDVASSTNMCSFVAAANALRATGARHFATVYDVIRASGMTIEQAAGGAWLRQLFGALGELGAHPVMLQGINSAGALVTMLQRAGGRGVALFSVHWSRAAGHTMVAFLEGGQLRILDRTGRIFRSFQEMEQALGNVHVPNLPSQWTRPFIGPPSTGAGWAPDVLYLPEAVPLPGLSSAASAGLAAVASLSNTILEAVGFEARTVLLMSRNEADRIWRQTLGTHAPSGSQPELGRRDGETRF